MADTLDAELDKYAADVPATEQNSLDAELDKYAVDTPSVDTQKAVSAGVAAGFKDLAAGEEEITLEEAQRIEKEIKEQEAKDSLGLKTPFMTRKINPLEYLISPVGKGLEAFKEAKGVGEGFWSGIVEAGKEVGNIAKGTADFIPITSAETTARGVIKPNPNNPDTFILDREKLSKTYYPTAKLLDEEANRILKASGKEGDSKAKDELMAIAALRGSGNDPSITDHITEILDAATFNFGSYLMMQDKIKNSSLLKRPKNVSVLSPDEKAEANAYIQEANASDSPVKWKSKQAGEMTIEPKSTLESIEDFIYARNMSLNITSFASKNQQGLLQFGGMMLGNEFVNLAIKAVPWLAKTATGAKAPKAPLPVTVPAKTPLISKETLGTAARIGAESAVTGQAAIVGENIQDVRNQAMIDNLLMVTGINLTGLAVKKGVGQAAKAIKRVNVKDASSPNFLAIKQAKTYDEYQNNSNYTGFKVDLDDFNATKEIIEFTDKGIQDLHATFRDIKRDNHYDPATQQGAIELIKDIYSENPSPNAIKAQKQLETNFALTHDMTTMEEARVGQALEATFRGANTPADSDVKPHFLAAANIRSGVIERSLEETNFLERFQPLLHDPDKVFAELELNDRDLARAFKQHIESPFFSKEQFAYRAFSEFLNSPLNVGAKNDEQLGIKNVREVAQTLGGRNIVYKELAAKYSSTAPGVVNKDITTRIEFLKNDIKTSMEGDRGVVKLKQIALSSLDELFDVLVNQDKKTSYLSATMQNVSEELFLAKPTIDYIAKTAKEAGLDYGVIVARLNRYNDILAKRDAKIVELGEYKALHSNLNPNEVINRKIKYISNDDDRMAYALVKLPKENTLQYVMDSFFMGDRMHEDFSPIVGSVVTNIKNRQSIADEIATLEFAIRSDIEKPYDETQNGAIRALLPVLKSYEKDIRYHKQAYMDVSNGNINIITMLSSLRNSLDNIKNPILAKEVETLLQNRRGEFFQQMEDLQVKLTEEEQNAVWDWVSGSEHVRLKEQIYQHHILNEEFLNSMFKATNILGRELIDTYGDVYAARFGATLDKVAFHAFFVTLGNDYDRTSTVLGTLMPEMLKYKDVRQNERKEGDRKYFIGSFANMDVAERQIESLTQMSLGSHLTNLNNSLRVARREITEFISKEVAPVMLSSAAYINMENPTIRLMGKLAKGLDGFDAFLFIDKRKQNGTHEMTPFGQFLGSLINDKKFMDKMYTDGHSTGWTREHYAEIADRAENSGHFPQGMFREKNATLEKDAWADQVLNYWGDIFKQKDAAIMWEHLTEWRAEETKFLAKAFNKSNAEIARVNETYGTKYPLLEWREQRLENRLNHVDSSVTPYDVQFRDLRIERSYGTSKFAQSKNAKNYKEDNTKNFMDSFITDIWAGVTAAHTQHSRSNLLPITHNMDRLGYKAAAEYLIKTAALTNDTFLAMQAYKTSWPMEKLQQHQGSFKILTSPFVLTIKSLGTWISPFINMNNFTSLIKNSAEASMVSLIHGKKTVQKVLTLPVSFFTKLPMLVLYNKEGKARFTDTPLVYGEPRFAKIIDEVISDYRDVTHNDYINSLKTYTTQGVPYGASSLINLGKLEGTPLEKFEMGAWTVAGYSEKAASVTSDFIFRNFKERLELYITRNRLNNGAAFAQSIEALMKQNDFDGAYQLVKETLQFYTQPKIFEIYKHMENKFKQGKFEESLYSYLPAFVDAEVGRFGPVTLPEAVKTVSRYIPNFSLFHSAIALETMRAIGYVSTALQPNLPESKPAKVLLLKLAGSYLMVNASLNFMSHGTPDYVIKTMLDTSVMSKDFVDSASKSMPVWNAQQAFAKFIVNGPFPGTKLEEWVPLPAKLLFNDDRAATLKKGALEAIGVTSSGRGTNIPLFGIAAEKFSRVGRDAYEWYKSIDDFSELNINNPDAVAKDNFILSQIGSDHYKKFLEAVQKTDIESGTSKARQAYDTWRASIPSKMIDNLINLTPAEIIVNGLANPFYTNFLFDMLKKDGDITINRRVAEMRISEGKLNQAQYDLMEKPFTNLLNFTGMEPLYNKLAPPVLQNISEEIYKKLKLEKWDGSPESFASTMDSLLIFLTETGVLKDPTFAKNMAEQGKKNYKLMYPETEPMVKPQSEKEKEILLPRNILKHK